MRRLTGSSMKVRQRPASPLFLISQASDIQIRTCMAWFACRGRSHETDPACISGSLREGSQATMRGLLFTLSGHCHHAAAAEKERCGLTSAA